MKTQKLIAAMGLYIVFMFIGHQGPLAHHKKEDQPHTHNKHDNKTLKVRRSVPLTA